MTIYKKHYFGHRDNKFHPSKKIVFPNICSCCGKPLRRSGNDNQIGFLCKKCGPNHYGQEYGVTSCKNCPFYSECKMRVRLGFWLRCETPDYGDLERIKLNKHLDDNYVNKLIEMSMKGNGNRKVLEDIITNLIPNIYQEIVESEFINI